MELKTDIDFMYIAMLLQLLVIFIFLINVIDVVEV